MIALFALSICEYGSWDIGQIMRSNSAPTITAAQIRDFQNDEQSKDQIVVVDVRSKDETDVSVIPGALTQSEFEESASEHMGKTIVVYCTIGVRSGRYASKLIQEGWDARNYEGSILDWCENKFPLATYDGKATKRVHTFSHRYSVAGEYVAVH